MLDFTDLGREFITLFVVIDPIGTIPVFMYAAANVPQRLHRLLAIRAVLISAIVLLAFLAGGQLLLETLGLRFGSFQVAGGIILFVFAMSMIFGSSKPQEEIEDAARDHLAGAVFPLAMPSIASPGAMLAIVILTDNKENTLAEQAVTAGLLILVLLLVMLLLLAAPLVFRIIGNTGTSVISRVMGVILATIAVDSVIGGLDSLSIFDVPTAQEEQVLEP